MGAGLATGQPALLARALRSISGAERRVHRHRRRWRRAEPGAQRAIARRRVRPAQPAGHRRTSWAGTRSRCRRRSPCWPGAGDAGGHAAGDRPAGRSRRRGRRCIWAASVDLSPTTAKEAAQQELLRSLPSLRALPGADRRRCAATEIGAGAAADRCLLRARSAGTSTSWMDQAMFTAVAAVGLLASTLMLVGAALAGPEHEIGGLLAVGYIGLVISSVMLMRVVAQILRREAESEGDGNRESHDEPTDRADQATARGPAGCGSRRSTRAECSARGPPIPTSWPELDRLARRRLSPPRLRVRRRRSRAARQTMRADRAAFERRQLLPADAARRRRPGHHGGAVRPPVARAVAARADRRARHPAPGGGRRRRDSRCGARCSVSSSRTRRRDRWRTAPRRWATRRGGSSCTGRPPTSWWRAWSGARRRPAARPSSSPWTPPCWAGGRGISTRATCRSRWATGSPSTPATRFSARLVGRARHAARRRRRSRRRDPCAGQVVGQDVPECARAGRSANLPFARAAVQTFLETYSRPSLTWADLPTLRR